MQAPEMEKIRTVEQNGFAKPSFLTPYPEINLRDIDFPFLQYLVRSKWFFFSPQFSSFLQTPPALSSIDALIRSTVMCNEFFVPAYRKSIIISLSECLDRDDR
jgi:hypothetical protein